MMTRNTSVTIEEHECRARALQNALIAGEQSGDPHPFDFDGFETRKRAKRGRQ